MELLNLLNSFAYHQEGITITLDQSQIEEILTSTTDQVIQLETSIFETEKRVTDILGNLKPIMNENKINEKHCLLLVESNLYNPLMMNEISQLASEIPFTKMGMKKTESVESLRIYLILYQ